MSACDAGVNAEYKGVADVTYPLVTIEGSPYCTATKIADETLLTAAHCLGNPKGGMVLRHDGRLVRFTVINQDTKTDLALIKADVVGPNADIQKFEPLQYDDVVAAGFPYGVALLITKGLWVGDAFPPDLKDHSVVGVSVAGGNSGGGIFISTSTGWKLVAVVQMKSTDSSVCLVSKPSVLAEFLK